VLQALCAIATTFAKKKRIATSLATLVLGYKGEDVASGDRPVLSVLTTTMMASACALR
jgi:hypothetical protein